MITHEKVGYTGYVASDDTLFKNAAEYGTTDHYPGYIFLLGKWISDVAKSSTVRFKLDMHTAGGVSSSVELWIDGELIHYFMTTNNNYESKSKDLDVTWARGADFLIRGFTNAGGALIFKNTEFAGTISPVRLWEA